MLKLSILIAGLLASGNAGADQNSVNPNWLRFQQESPAYMNEIPLKRASAGSPKTLPVSSSEKFEARVHTWPQLNRPRYFSGETSSLRKVLSFFSLQEFAERGTKPIFNLQGLETASLTESRTPSQPWSGSYWPIYEGGLASRYASASHYGGDSSWRSFHDRMKKAGSLAEIAARALPAELDELSPSEKYDLLIGGEKQLKKSAYGFLTQAMWKNGESYANSNGRVEPWMGYCHGWAPASLVEKRPIKVVSATADSGHELQFYPADVKGLSSLLWAEGDYSQRFLGGRCGSKRPKTDPETGRLLDADCLDVNPGIWHLVLTNQLGILKRGLVIDATFDYEVWNQPVFNYHYKYFNPETGKDSSNLKDAVIETASYKKDKFKKYRSTEAAFIVGIEMTIEYTSETSANHAETDSDEDDATREVSYVYDLELNEKGDVIGGEWYQNAHPDFLWVPERDARPISAGDSQLSDTQAWSIKDPLPQFWKDIAIRTALVTGAPLGKIVDPLIEAAAQQ